MKGATSPRDLVYRTMDRVAEILDFRGVHKAESARQWCRDKGIPFYRDGRRLRVHIDDVHEVITTGQCVAGLERRQRELSRAATPMRRVG